MTSFDRLRAGSRRTRLHALEQPPATVDSQPTVASQTTVDKLSTVAKPPKTRPATLVQHGHTPGEHALYMALWNLASEATKDFRDVSIGYDKMAAAVGGSKRNMQRLTESLTGKLAIEITGREDSGTRQGKTYRIYSMAEILRRRREAGMTSVRRDRSAVELVRVSTVDNPATVGSLTTGTVDSLSAATVDSLSTPFSKELRKSIGDICGRCAGLGYVIESRTVRGLGQPVRTPCSCVSLKRNGPHR